MKEMKRYLTSHGTMCEGADVAELEAIHAELLEAAERIAARLDNPVLWNFDQRTTVLFDQLRAAIVNAKERRYE